MRKQLYIAAALQLTFCWVLPAQSSILFQTTTPPSSAQNGGGTISTNPVSFIGNYFTLTAPAQVDTLSVAASELDNGTIFGAILSVPSLGSLPTGQPFGTSGLSAPLATAILKPATTNSIVSGSFMPVTLPAGTYIVVFGTGQFGASSGSATLWFSDGSQVAHPPLNQVLYTPSCNSGTTQCWSTSSGITAPYYFAVSGTSSQSGITSLNPNFAAPGGSAFTLQVNGSGFQPTSTVSWGGASLVTSFVSGSLLTAQVPASLIASPGVVPITVTTNNVVSSAFNFTIGASGGPVISTISPTAVPPGSGGFTLTVNGSGFASGAIIYFNNSILITNFNSTTQLTGSVSAGLVASGGTATITVQNSNGATSNTLTFVIGQPSAIPTLTNVSPTSATVGGAAFTMTLNGTNFTSNSAVQWNNTLLPTTYVSPTQLTAAVAASLISSATTVQVSVNNPGAGTSNLVSFSVVSANAPTITSLSPSSVPPGGQTFTLTVNGTNFTNTSAVEWNGSILATTPVSATQITASVPASLIAAAGTANVTVLNPGSVSSNAQTFTIANTPPPVLSSLSPSTAAPGGPQFTLTVNGSNFVANSAILWNGSLQVTNYVSSTQLTANIGAGLIATAGTANVTVSSPGSGASAALPFTIATPTGPTISSLSPSSAVPGGPSFILTVNGSGFTSSSSIVQWNTTPLVTVFISATQLQASVSNTLIASAGVANITVTTGSVSSNAFGFAIGATNTPVLSSLSPNSATVGGAQFTLTATGGNFVNGATITWNGGLLTTTFVSATQLNATVPASLIAAAGTAQVTVINPTGTSNTSQALTFQVTNASSPTVSSLSPGSVAAGAAQFTLTVNGQGFLSGAQVRWNGAALSSTNFVGSSQLTASVPANLVTSAGSATITVVNPGGAISNSLNFTINASSNDVTLFQTTLPPSPGQPGFSSISSIQFLGNYFVLSSPAQVDSISTYAQASDGGTIFGAIIAVPNLTTPPSGNPFDGTTVVSATLHPGTTSSIVTASFPPVTLPAGTYAIVFGSGLFGATSTTALAAQSNGGSANVPLGWNQVSWGYYCGQSNPCWSAGFNSLSQFYFGVGGAPSTQAGLSITSLTPASVTAGSGTFTLTVTGTGFASGSIVEWNGSQLPTQVTNSTQLTATVLANLVQSVGSASVTVLNSTNNAISNAMTFTISSLVSSITSLSPSTATAGGPAFTLTVNGSGFSNGSTVQWNGSPLTTTFVNSTQVTANVPASLIASNGTASIAVLSPGGLFTNFMNFTVGSATPAISSLNPNSVVAGSSSLTILVTGSGFLNGSSVLWAGSALQTSYISGTQLSVIIPSGFLANAGSASITVQNPGGATSNAVVFLVLPIGTGGGATAGLAHYAVGSNWTTGIYVINSGGNTANYSVSFFDDNGNPAALPFSTGSTTRLSGTLPPYGSLYLEAANPSGALISGWGQITADTGVVIQSIFRSTLNNTHYEAAVASSTGSKAFELPFDATNFAGTNVPLYTGIAIANLDTANTAQVSCIARDVSGNTIPNGVTIPTIRPEGHWAGFQFPVLTGQRGTLDCTSTTTVVVVALRFIGTDTFSSLPVIKK